MHESMKITIRNASLTDSGSVAELTGQLGYQSDHRAIQERLGGLLEQEEDCVFVALDTEKVVGWVHGFYSRRIESEPFVEIGGLVVSGNYRNKGIAKLLVEEIYMWARTLACKKIRVRSNTIRKPAHGFYMKLGFEFEKEQKIFGKMLE